MTTPASVLSVLKHAAEAATAATWEAAETAFMEPTNQAAKAEVRRLAALADEAEARYARAKAAA
jgi:hypothetical protein